MTDTDELLAIHQLADQFREALERIGQASCSCDLVSWMLVVYFQDVARLDGFKVRTAKRESGLLYHCWLVRGDLHVDLTADQFGQAPVIVQRQSAWHESLTFVRDDLVGNEWIEDDEELKGIYAHILSILEPQEGE